MDGIRQRYALKTPRDSLHHHRKSQLRAFFEQEEVETEAVIKTKDTRKEVVNTFQWPFCAIGEIISKFYKDGIESETRGTITMVGPKVGITAAHNIYSHQFGEATESSITLGVRGSYRIARSMGKKPFIFPAYYRKLPFAERIEYDYAFVVLDTDDLTGFTGFIGMKTHFDQSSEIVGIYGYPQDKYLYSGAGEINSFLWGDVGKIGILPSCENTFMYHIPTNAGQSGAAILALNGYGTRIVGVHTNGGKSVNLGIKLTFEMLESARRDLADFHGLLLY